MRAYKMPSGEIAVVLSLDEAKSLLDPIHDNNNMVRCTNQQSLTAWIRAAVDDKS